MHAFNRDVRYVPLLVFAINVSIYDSQSINGLNYECVVGSNTVIPATRVSDTTVVCNIGQGNEVSSSRNIFLVTL